MLQRAQARYRFRAGFFGDGFNRSCAGVRTDAHTAKADVETANEGYIATAELFAPDVRGSSEKYLMMRTDEDP